MVCVGNERIQIPFVIFKTVIDNTDPFCCDMFINLIKYERQKLILKKSLVK